ncbi:MAG: T9SS type A sorting domain-containing protein [Ignavibacteriaceae bacterium]
MKKSILLFSILALLYTSTALAQPMAGDYTVGLSAFKEATGLSISFEKRIRTVEFTETRIDPVTEEQTGIYEETVNGTVTVREPADPSLLVPQTFKNTVEQAYYVPVVNGKQYYGALYHKYTDAQKLALNTEAVGVYTTITAAIADVSTRGVSGAVRFLLVDATYATETFPILVGTIAGVSATNTITLLPNTGITTTLAGSTATPIIDLSGASYFIIDGRAGGTGTSINLTIENTATTGTASHTIRFINGAKYNTVRYTNVYNNTQGTAGPRALDYGVSATDIVGNSFNSVEYCVIKGGRSGAGFAGTTANPNNGNSFYRNTFVDFSYAGIWFSSNTSNTTIIENKFYHTTGYNVQATAISVGATATLGTTNIIGNHFYDLENTTTSTLRVISGTPGTLGTLNIINNFFSLTKDNGTKTSIYAIQISGTTEYTVNCLYNTFKLGGTHTGGTTGNIISAGLIKSNTGAAAVFNAMNNISINSRTGGTAGTIHTNFFAGSTNLVGTLAIDYNCWYADPGTGSFHSGWGGYVYNDITLYHDSTGTQEQHTIFKNVQFTSGTDLHLAGASISDLDLIGTPIAGITTDFDGDPRNPTMPFRGGDEGTQGGATGLSGIYYVGAAGTGPGGTDPHFNSFKKVVDTLSTGVIGGDIFIYITSDLTETYADVQGIGLAVNPEPYNITFKPYTGVQPVITLNYPTDLNGGPSGAFVIGMPSAGNIAWDSMKTVKNITFDGSNTAEGNTRDLTIQCATTAHRNAMPVVITGNSSFITFKNVKIYYKAQGVSTSGNLFIGAVMVRSRNYLGVDWVPHDLTFDNCHLSGNFDGVYQNAQGYGTYQTGTPIPLNYPYNITLKNNLIEGKRRGVALYVAGSHDIFGNEVVLNQNIAANINNEAIYAVNVDTGSVVNIYNNKITGITGMTSGAAATLNGISIETFGTYNIHNNMIYGFGLTAVNPTVVVTGIRNTSANATLNLYFNSMYMDNLPEAGTGVITYNGIFMNNGTNDVKNNAVVSGETDFTSYCINLTGATGTLTSDYNDFYPMNATNGHVGFFNATATKTLAEWKMASGQDAHSWSENPNFASIVNLHITSISYAVIGKGVTLPGYTSDIDGDLRDVPPEIGADEIPGLIPVELTSFKANVTGSSVQLTWQTATETNSAYFEIQRKSDNSSWLSIGRVNGAGTTTSAVNYSFTDEAVTGSTVNYRLKQVDFDGSFAYSKEIEVELDLPTVFELSQNYPNPFNPTTTIRYAIPQESKVTLEVYTVLGEMVATLVNDIQPAGKYSVMLDGSRLSSGTYVYRLVAGNNVITKKMVLIK